MGVSKNQVDVELVPNANGTDTATVHEEFVTLSLALTGRVGCWSDRVIPCEFF
jgi:hypothetical protein